MEPNPPPTPASPNPEGHKHFNWIGILALFLAPAIIALLSPMVGLDWLAVASPILGGLVGGIYSGVRLAKRFSASTYPGILIGLFFGTIAACVIIGIGFVGCMVGGYTLDLR